MSESKMVTFPADTVIVREGEKNEYMYLIVKGHVELHVGYETPLGSLLGIIGEKSCFGELGLLVKKPAIYTAVAYDEVVAMRIGDGDLESFVTHNETNVIEIMRNMAYGMMTMRLQIDLLLQEIENGSSDGKININECARQARQTMRKYAIPGSNYWDDELFS